MTEYDYLAMINNAYGDRYRFRLDFPPRRVRRNGLRPYAVIDHALTAVGQVDEVWALFDRDQHTEIPNAIRDGQRGGVKVAFSNPSFDLWLLLHFQQYTPTTGGVSAEIHTKLEGYATFGGFGKGDKHITEARAAALVGRIENAVKHARAEVDACPTGICSASAGHHASCDPLRRDPSTDVYLLVESLSIVPLPR